MEFARHVSCRDEAVVVVDAISTGRKLASIAIGRGLNVIHLVSNAAASASGLGACGNLPFVATVDERDTFEETVAALEALPFNIIASTVGCESAVELNDQLSEILGLSTSNGTALSEARRDKWAMAERVRECGVRAVKQCVATRFEEVVTFVESNRLQKYILKPRRSAGSDGVFFCENLVEARDHFNTILSRPTIFGESSRDVLVQEFLHGKEYVVDTVTCNGEHKVVAFWEYDKRPTNGSKFVYFDMHLYQTQDGIKEQRMGEYVFSVLDALGVQFGPSHAEVIWLENEDAPCLVEVGTRPHGAGGNFSEMCDSVIGYNQLGVTLDSYLRPEDFKKVPEMPGKYSGMGMEFFFVSRKEGSLEKIHMQGVESLASYHGHDLHVDIGGKVKKTVDLMTTPGVVRLYDNDREQVFRDSDFIRTLEADIFQLEKSKEAVIIVDAISTGRKLAGIAIDQGLNVIHLVSNCAELASGLGACGDLDFVCTIKEKETVDDTVKAIQKLPYEIKASTVGCESAVELNDAISSRLGLSTSNGEHMSEARRDKWAMAERVRECGVRAVNQCVATSFQDVVSFVTKHQLSQFILKPRRSAASDGVYFCDNLVEAQEHFSEILLRDTIFGESIPDVLVQEYLVGKEYVVDTVSCDGVHKVVAFWEYDKRPTNGAKFVYYDMHLFETEDGHKEQCMADYVFSVLNALDVQYGPSHAEVIWLENEDAPCLVEVGTRPHGAGGNFAEMCDAVIGYNQLGATLDAYLRPESFSQIPERPLALRGLGAEFFFVSRQEGLLEHIETKDVISRPSFRGLDLHINVGEHMKKTVDLMTTPGIVRLCHSDKDVVLRDAKYLHENEHQYFKVASCPN
eukprot:CAMPEP_0113934136 /NCGR_PEP_ID=MMETSP1339-20121228/1456_1 /TAXON_ID=94617 /ORGANISM="Fibrocapsa japonica" /LENGTH=854 /DNA_ID=CAMNT_0000935799 /DNA_START=152 /DNA_END=2716 /DNA_ORIENTATION=+ /assembly_acc=CAM_ASM_000762